MPARSTQARNVSLVVASAFFIQILDGVIIVTALPQIAAAFGVDTLQMSIGVTAYVLATAVCIPAAGWIADRLGAKRVLLASMLIFTLASLACGLANGIVEFVIFRAIQGAGGALMAPIGRIIVLRTAQKSEIVQAIGLTVWPALFAPVVGPALGGFLTAYVSWRWNFWINIPLGAIGLALVWRIIPRDVEFHDKPFDLPGFLLCAIGLGCLLYGFDSLVQGTLPRPVAIALIIVGAIGGIAAVLWLRRRAHPLLDLTASRVRTFALSELLAGFLLRLSINSPPFLLPLMFQVGFGLDPLQSGGFVIAYFLGNLVMKSATTPILRHFGFRTILSVNGTIAGLSIAAFGFFEPTTPLPVMIPILFVAGLSRSMQFTSLATLAFADIDAARRSSASTLSSMFQQIAMVFGVAVAAGFLALTQSFRSMPRLDLIDFRIAFLLMGVICVGASLWMLILPRDAGAEVSGHRRPQTA